MKRLITLILYFFVLFNISCTHKNGVVQPDIGNEKNNNTFTSFHDVVYGTDHVQQSMDVFLPGNSNRQTTAIVIFIHGGAWSSGEKGDFNGLGLDTFFTNANCAMVNINYRLDMQYPYPASLDDIDSVIRYIELRADEWHINPDRICLFGRSSGAHLALQYAHTRNKSKKIKVVVDCFGPVDLTENSIANGPLKINVEVMLGPYVYNEALWREASPINHMAGAVPTVIMQGTADSVVFAVQSLILKDSLFARNIPYLYLPWQGNGHGWNKDRWRESRDVTLAWMKMYL